MTLNEIVNDILKKEDDQMARVFTMTISRLLISKGIQPIAIKSLDEWSIDDDINKYVMRNRYKCTFDIDTSKHDAKVRADAINECCELDILKYKICCPLCDSEKCVKGSDKCDAEIWKREQLKENL